MTPNYMLQQTGATCIRLYASIRYFKFKVTNVERKAPAAEHGR